MTDISAEELLALAQQMALENRLLQLRAASAEAECVHLRQELDQLKADASKEPG